MIAAALVTISGAVGAVHLRGQPQPDPRAVAQVSAAGVLLADDVGTLVGWEQVRGLTGDDAADAERYEWLLDNAWRARARVMRGDLSLAAPLLERMETLVRDERGPTAFLAAGGLAASRVAEGRIAEALEPALRARAAADDVDDALAARLHYDEAWGAFPALPPLPLAGLNVEGWAAIPASIQSAGPRAQKLAAWYAYAAMLAEKATATEPEACDDDQLCLLVSRMVRAAMDPRPDVRARARDELSRAAAGDRPPWVLAWTRLAVGRSLVREPDRPAQIAGVLELLRAASMGLDGLDALTIGAVRDAAEACQAIGLSAESATLRGLELPLPRIATVVDEIDPLDGWLGALKLPALRAALLEEVLEDAPAGASGDEVARRLAQAYVDVLDATSDAARRAEIEQRATKLLSDRPAADSADLRLSLARSMYERTEAIVERHRLRLAEPAEIEAARESLSRLIESLTQLATQAARRVEQLEKQEENVTGPSDRAMLSEGLTQARRTRSVAHFLAGWSSIYAAELTAGEERRGLAAKSLRHFGWLLNAAPGEAPTIERLPEQSVTFEHVGRAVLGVAMATSLLGDDIGAMRWIEVLEKNGPPPPSIASQMLARRAIVLSRAGRWDDLAVLVPRGPGGVLGAGLAPVDARLITVLALEARAAGNAPQTAATLGEAGLAALAAQGQIGQVLDLATRYFDGLDGVASGAFMPAYIRGLREVERARRALAESGEREDQPATSPVASASFESASKFLTIALESSDAARFAPALPGVSLLRARTAFGAARQPEALRKAADLFVTASEALEPVDRQQAVLALRMAIRAIDLAIETGKSDALTAQRRTVADRVISRFPDDPAAAVLVYERALSGAVPIETAIEDLLRLSENGSTGIAARHQASRLLYEQWRGASGDRKAALGERFLDAALPGLDDARRLTAGDGRDVVLRAVTHARRVLDVALSSTPPDTQSAERGIDLLQSLVSRGMVDDPAVLAEFEYRRVQAAIAQRDLDAAELALGRLGGHDERLASSALRLLYQRAAEEWGGSAPGSEERRREGQRVARLGAIVLGELKEPDRDVLRPDVATLHLVVARACAELYFTQGDETMRRTADLLFKRLVSAHPRESSFLQSAGRFWFTSQDTEPALAAWRTLAGGLPQGSTDWFEARWHVLTMLEGLDPGRARALLAQHRVLYPDDGPPPWGPKITEIGSRLSAPGGTP